MLDMLHDQTTFSGVQKGVYGDCCRACVATILNIYPSELPHPIAGPDRWNTAFFKALHARGYSMRTIAYTEEVAEARHITDTYWGHLPVPQIVMATGPSPRGPWHHAVVYDRHAQRMIHDPHPSRAGLVRITGFDYLMPYPHPDAEKAAA